MTAHLYRPGARWPVCLDPVWRGSAVTSVRYAELCSTCLAWRIWQCGEIKRQHGL